jgi:uncharacterized cupin superfamily protein
MKQITPRVYAWSQYLPETQLDRNGHFLLMAPGQPGVLIDPVPLQPGDREHLAALGGVTAVLLTQPDVREAAWCQREFGCRVIVPAGEGIGSREDREGVVSFSPGDPLPGGLEAVRLPGAAAADEVAYFHGPSGSAILGSAVAGAPAGELNLIGTAASGRDGPASAAEATAAEEGAAAQAIAHALRALLGRPVQRVLVRTGQPVLREAEKVLWELVARHDPAACLLRPAELVWQAPREKGSRFARRSAECSRLLGLKTLDFEVTVVPPGKQNTLRHSHAGYEEAFIILEGEGELLTDRGTFPVQTGDMLGFGARNHPAHALRNTGTVDLRFLSFGGWVHPSEAVGLAEYPDSGKQLQWLGPGRMRLFYLPENVRVDYWEGERLD